MREVNPADSGEFDRVHALFDRAIDLPAGEREAFVRAEAGDDLALRDEVLRLLPRVDEKTANVVAKVPPPPEPPKSDRALPDHIGPYRIVAELGEGGMGTVFLGEHAVLGRRAAIKLVRDDFLRHPGSRERFEREMRTLSQLDHKNICKVFEVGDDDGVPFMAMQWVKGKTLAQLLDEARSNGPAPKARSAHAPSSSSRPSSRAELDLTIRRIEKIASALHTAHQQGVLHRDVKPGNIMIADDGEPIVLDFGLAREEVRGEQRHTSSGAMVGTLPYMAPEQVRAEDELIDRRTDVYALGVVLYECLTLQLPFQARSQTDLMREILRAAPIPARRLNRSVPFDLQVVLEKAMDPDPARRYATALAFAEDLQRVREFQPILASRLGMGLRLRRWSQRNPAAAVALVLLSTGLGIVGTMSVKLVEARERESQAASAAREGEQRAALAAAGERRSRAETAMQAAALAVTYGRWEEALRH